MQSQRFSWPQPAEPKMHVYKWKTTSRENSSIFWFFLSQITKIAWHAQNRYVFLYIWPIIFATFTKKLRLLIKNDTICSKPLRFPLFLTKHKCNFYENVTAFHQKCHEPFQIVTLSIIFDQTKLTTFDRPPNPSPNPLQNL